MAIFAHAIPDVIPICSGEKMFRVDASPIVAVMTNKKPGWYLANKRLV